MEICSAIAAGTKAKERKKNAVHSVIVLELSATICSNESNEKKRVSQRVREENQRKREREKIVAISEKNPSA